MSKAHWLALTSVGGIGGATVRRLIEEFGSVEAIFSADPTDLARLPRISEDMAARLLAVSFDEIEDGMASLSDEGIEVLTWEDDDYPPNLILVNDAPPVLFVQGNLRRSDREAVAIVGTREPTPAATELATRLACELAGRGLTVVSGLALGIDAAAHEGALQAEGGRTLAVLGSGLRNIFPRQNATLAEHVVRHGAMLSELRPNVSASAASLMARDRIVSGLSRAVIVVEAREQSGTMDTARRARAQGRLLIAVPGSPGPQRLLADGALKLDPEALDLDALAERIRAYALGGDAGQQLGLFP